MKPRIHIAVLLACAALGVSAFAQKPLGAWKGSVEMAMPMPSSEAERKHQDQFQAQTHTTLFHLTFEAGNKCSMSVQNGLTGNSGAKAAEDEGTWTQSGRFISLHLSKSQTPPLSGNISPNAKLPSLFLVGNGGASGRLSFVRS